MFRQQTHRQITLAVLIFLTCLTGSVLFLYLQTSLWLNGQQRDNMTLARNQLESLLGDVNQSAKGMATLIGAPCSSQTIAELRRQLAITPNVGNIELATSGSVYCSSLEGAVAPGTDKREPFSLYLSSDIKALPGHAFVLFHLHEGLHELYTSTDGYYIRNILESASGLASVMMITERGWMAQDGKVHLTPSETAQAIRVQSELYPFSLTASMDSEAVLVACLKNGQLTMLILFCLSTAVGGVSYVWLGQATTPARLLMTAMKNRELQPYFQPIVKGDPPVPVGCEVLIRWQHQDSLIPPDQFIPMAEQSGLIIPMTQRLIVDVTDQFAAGYRPLSPFYISINVSACYLQSETIETDVDYFISRAGSNISLVLEITEREILSDNERVNRNIERLKARGVRFALDDFGTGYSTLETLHRTPIDLIKIDKLFISGIGKKSLCNDIIGNVVDLANRIHADIIAEGVETEDQLAFLKL